MLNPGREIGGECVHVGDSYVWSEIQYLDSPTNYREFLPQRLIQPTTIHSELVMLDSRRSATTKGGVVLWLIPVVIIMLLLYFKL